MAETEQEKRNTRNWRGLLSVWGIVIATSTFGWTLAQGVAGVYNYIRIELSASAECCRDFQTYKDEDSYQRKYWVGVIGSLQEDMREHGERIIRLRDAIDAVDERVRAVPKSWSYDESNRYSIAVVSQLDEIRRRLEALESHHERAQK